MFGATRILKYSDKENYVYSGYGITFDSVGSWIFANDTARNVIIFGVIIVHHLMLTIAKLIFLC